MKKKQPTRRLSKCRHRSQKKRCVFGTRNWPEYNRSLVARGSLTIWIEADVLRDWNRCELTGKRGASRTYNDNVIIMALTLKEVYRQTLRGTQGLLSSVLRLMKLEDFQVPDYSTLSRRGGRVQIPLGDAASSGAVHLVVDSTGCKVFGEGEWKVRKHGYNKRRTWRTLHLGLDEASGEIKAAMFTTNNITDGQVLPDIIDQVLEPIGQLSGDGAYDKRNCYETLAERQQAQGQEIKITIPPQRNARIWTHGNTKGERQPRDENLRRIRKVGRKKWKVESGYHRRSLGETAMFRYKTTFGEKINARNFENQATEAFIHCNILNRMNQMARPDSYLVQS